LLAGTSGTGKTTLARRMVEAGARLVSHDRTIVSRGWAAAPTPWGHDGRIPGPTRTLPLRSVLMLEQGLTNTSQRLQGARGVMRVAGSIVGGWAAKEVTTTSLGLAAAVVADVPCFASAVTNDDFASRHVVELVA
jgi:hypothetical protein